MWHSFGTPYVTSLATNYHWAPTISDHKKNKNIDYCFDHNHAKRVQVPGDQKFLILKAGFLLN